MDVSTVDSIGPVATATEFVAALRALCQRTKLTYRQLEDRARSAGFRLPRSTIASVMAGKGVPREQTVTSFVLACGGDWSAVEMWLAARRRIATSERAVSDLAGAVEAWITTRWPIRQPRQAEVDLAAEVEAWLAARTSALDAGRRAVTSPGVGHEGEQPAVTYSQGRLAEAVADQTSTSRWIGVHRRNKRRAPKLPSMRSRRAGRPYSTGEYPLVNPRRYSTGEYPFVNPRR